MELAIDRSTQAGQQHHAGVSDVVVESAVTTIVDLEDSVATVDGPDKVGAYRTWLGLRTGRLTATFGKDGRELTRRLNGDRTYVGTDGGALTLPGRSLLLVRNVGHHMRLNAVRTAAGEPILEEVLDAVVSAVAVMHELRGLGRYRNTRTGSIYIVKPKMHGPEEVSLSVDLFAAVEEALGLAPATIKIGIMDEENAPHQSGGVHRPGERPGHLRQHRVLGPHWRRNPHRLRSRPDGLQGRGEDQTWFTAYEDRNVDVALRAGFAGRAQIGKGMWAKPAADARDARHKGAHPRAGASTAWVPSPTAATLHAVHYLQTDVLAVQQELAKRPLADRRALLVVPVLPDSGTSLSEQDKQHELETNAQSILGYVVRWVALGIGCSTVPNLEGVGLMEDRATLRISSQQIANWLHHGLVNEAQVRETFARMAALVDEQNGTEPGYQPMGKDLDSSPSFRAALDLVFSGRPSRTATPSGR